MEHSYSKDFHPKDNVEVMATRSILIPRPPQCPSCHQHTSNDDILAKLESQQSDPYFEQLPPAINDNIAKMAMDETDRLTRNVKNINSDEEDWDGKVNKFGWTKQQLNLYRQASNILDYDQLARLAVSGRLNEGIIRRCSIDKSVARMRLALASVHWDTRLTQWLHAVLSDHLPANYMASYLDILQTLRTKVPTLVDKMLSSRPISFNQDYLQAVMKRPWGANVPTKPRKLPGQSPIIVVIPSSLNNNAYQQPTSRMKRWYSLLGTMASVAPIQNAVRHTQPLEHVTEQLVAMTRTKIQDLRNEMPNRHIILVGINSGASIALQVSLVETVSSIVCMGFAYNTMKGVRGAPDDRILDITTPILFVLGENSARSSQEEIESLREKMSAQTSLVVVGSADDALRINKFNRHLEGVTQSMVDNMIADEIQDFVSTCIINPPGPREVLNNLNKRSIGIPSTTKENKQEKVKKRKHKDSVSKVDKGTPRKVGRPRLNKTIEMPSGKLKPERPKPTSALLKQSNESIKMAVQSILPSNEVPEVVATSTGDVTITLPSEAAPITASALDSSEILPTYEIVTTEKDGSTIQTLQPISNTALPSPIASSSPKMIQASPQFVQVKPPTTSGRVQSPNVKNFFIRKGVEKKTPNQSPTYFTVSPSIANTTTSASPTIAGNVPPNKKIIIKSQQIIVPGANVKQTKKPTQTITTVPGGTNSLNVVNAMDSVVTATSDLSGILDLPILFADSDGNITDHSASELLGSNSSVQIVGSPSSSDSNTPTVTPTNILITSPEGKLPNRSVVISAANVSKITKTTSQTTLPNNKVIFINRNQIKGTPIMPTATTSSPNVIKTIPALKLVSSSSSSSVVTTTSPITLQNALTKLTPGTKIDLSTLKIVKSIGSGGGGSGNTTTTSGIVATKPIVINKSGMIGAPTARNTFVIKSPAGSGGNLQAHPVIKGGVINRNITVRKVMNLVPSPKQQTTAQIAATSTIATSVNTVVVSGPKTSAATNAQTFQTVTPIVAATSPKTTAASKRKS